MQFWWVDDVNLFVKNAFSGQGYIKKVYKAQTDRYGKLKFDEYGEPICKPKEDDVVDEEAGYIMSHQDTE